MTDFDSLISQSEAAQLVGCTRQNIHIFANKHKLRNYRRSRNVYYYRDEFMEKWNELHPVANDSFHSRPTPQPLT